MVIEKGLTGWGGLFEGEPVGQHGLGEGRGGEVVRRSRWSVRGKGPSFEA